jgi:trimethylamine-N-oxide reductase (cytochrome c)
MMFSRFSLILWGLKMLLRYSAWRYKAFAERLAEVNFTAQMQTADGSVGRWFRFGDGRVVSGAGVDPDAEVVLSFKDARIAAELLMPPIDQQEQIDALKDFKLKMEGPDELTSWFTRTLLLTQTIGWKYGTPQGDGGLRYTSMTNGGPVFVYVRDGKIERITPIVFDETDAEPWTIKARGREYTPPRKTTLAPHGQNFKSVIYSPDRCLYPMKRVDFDPDGERNPQNRGVSGYEQISWDEALDIVAGEIKRMKRDYGPGAIASSHGSHHTWGNIGYYLSANFRFMNAIGHTEVHHNPDSWEGWYWGASHHWGYSLRVGQCENYGTTVRRQWLKDSGIKIVHIDPYFNDTAQFLGGKWIAPKPTTSPALGVALAYVWITENLYDKDYVAIRTKGFDKWKAYVLGDDDGTPKTPEWAAEETGIPAREIRALAREWGTKRTYLGAGGWGTGHGGACRNATGIQWARVCVCLMAMQGLGKPGVNFGNLQWGTPVDFNFYFPGYAEGGMSGDMEHTAMAVELFQRMPQLPTMNTASQKIPRLSFPEAILEGKAEGYMWDGKTIEAQFNKIVYPKPGQAAVRMLYKYGGSAIATMPDTNRWVAAYRSANLEFVVNQSIWMEGEAKFADVILPACTNFERPDISEWAGLGGYAHHGEMQLNHRVIVFQHKCIEPMGESRSVLAGIPPQGLLRGAGGTRGTARADRLPLVRRRPQEGRAGAPPAAGGLYRRIPQGPANPVGPHRIRLREPQAVRRRGPRTPAGDALRPGLRGPPRCRAFRQVSAASVDAAPTLQLPHPGRRQGQLHQRYPRPPRFGRWPLLLDHPLECRGRRRPGDRDRRPGEGLQRPRRRHLRRPDYRPPARRHRPRLRILGQLPAHGRARTQRRYRRLPQPAVA